MGPAEVKTIIYDLLVELLGSIAIPTLSILVTVFLAAVSAAWILVKKLVTGPIENLTVKFEELSLQMIKVESVHGERMLAMERDHNEFKKKHSALDGRVQQLERHLKRAKGEKHGRSTRD